MQLREASWLIEITSSPVSSRDVCDVCDLFWNSLFDIISEREKSLGKILFKPGLEVK